MANDVRENAVRSLREAQGLAKLVGAAPAFRAAIAQIPAMARSSATVMIEGETGTGKELVARAIHYLSPRADFPFVSLNCGALPDTLVEAELFGHERGAFTDAQSRRPGLIAEAEQGTLFLDEVNGLSPRAQVALLRVLQDGTFRALGSSREQQADLRFVAASNTPLARLVKTGEFRRDLYYRLRVFSISLPPLRERGEDIPLLASHFIQKHAPQGAPLPTLSAASRAALLAFHWPGNIRELENAILRAVQLCQRGAIGPADLDLPVPETGMPDPAPPILRPARSFKGRKREIIAEFERQQLARLLAEHRGNITHAARAAGKERRDFGKLLKKYLINPKSFTTPP